MTALEQSAKGHIYASSGASEADGTQKPVATLAIQVYGLMRSGNHAIIDWIKNQYPGQSICFLNNIALGPSDPYQDYVQIELTNIPSDLGVESLRRHPKDVLIYSYEDRSSLETGNGSLLQTLFDPTNQTIVKRNLLSYQHHFTTGILRDPYNCLASRIALIRKRGALGGTTDLQLIKENWKQIARKALSLEAQPKDNEQVILYNKWVESNSYRREISRKLLGTYQDNSLATISGYGGGSSFQVKKRFSFRTALSKVSKKWKKALHPATLASLPNHINSLMVPHLDTAQLSSRWEALATDEEYRDLFRDTELVGLSRDLFGVLKNEQAFLDSL